MKLEKYMSIGILVKKNMTIKKNVHTKNMTIMTITTKSTAMTMKE
jgi:hypothetical protein